MTPYYDEDGITIYHGDCREVLPSIEVADVGLVLTDPPYGMAYKAQRDGRERSRRTQWIVPSVVGDNETFDPTPLLRFPNVILWGANWYANRLPISGGWIIWDKKPMGKRRGFMSSDVELAWSNVTGRTHKAAIQWDGSERDSDEGFLHPTQKPVTLMRWLLDEFMPPYGLVLDPYLGSGSTLIAARARGSRAIGIEIEEKYCEIAVQRLAQGVLALENT
jgi:DNA modification methylase